MSHKRPKLLILGGKPIGSVELVEKAREMGVHTIVSDYLPAEQSPAKALADEAWPISTAEVELLAERCRLEQVDGILTAVHEFNINRMLDLCERLGKPCYCNRSTWLYCDNKVAFKSLCERNSIPVARQYNVSPSEASAFETLPYPVIVKPVDGSGSRGFAICHTPGEFAENYRRALLFSPGKQVLIEDYIPYDSVIIHYTMVDGVCHYSGMSDKYSARFASTGASVMGLQTFPSDGEKYYIQELDARVRAMFEQAGFTDGPIWIEAFYDSKNLFIFNEMGYRLGGSLTHYPVKHFYGVDQLEIMLHKALGEHTMSPRFERLALQNKYCILPIHLKPGVICNVRGVEHVRAREDVHAYVAVHHAGDTIDEWGSAQQVFCYLHILYKDTAGLKASASAILSQLHALDENGSDMLYTLFDFNRI